jgi:hypothetical protein
MAKEKQIKSILMKSIFILALTGMLSWGCTPKNPTADFNVHILFPESFTPERIDLGEEIEDACLLYDTEGGVIQILLISRKPYLTQKMFKEPFIAGIIRENDKWLQFLDWVKEAKDVNSLINEEDTASFKSLPKIRFSNAEPVLKMYLNVNGEYGRRHLSGFTLNDGKEEFPMLVHTIHNKEKNTILYLQYLRIRDGKGEPIEKYDDMMKAIEDARLL